MTPYAPEMSVDPAAAAAMDEEQRRRAAAMAGTGQSVDPAAAAAAASANTVQTDYLAGAQSVDPAAAAAAPTAMAAAPRPAMPLLSPGVAYAGGPNATARQLTQESPNLEASLAGQYAADSRAAMAEASGAQQLAAREAEVMRRMDVSYADEMARQRAYAEQERKTLLDLQSETDALAKAVPQQRSAGEVFAGMSTGKQIASAMGMILGSIGAAITGKDNPAQAYLERSAERDYRNQVAQYQAAKTAAEKRATVYGQLMERYKDPIMAERQYRAHQADQMSRYASQIGNTTKSQVVAERANALAAQYQGKAAEQRMAIAKEIRANTSSGGVTGPTINPLAVQEYLARGGSMDELQKSIAAGKAMGMSPAVAAAMHIGSGATGPADKDKAASVERGTMELAKREADAGLDAAQSSLNDVSTMLDKNKGDPAGLGLYGSVMGNAGVAGSLLMTRDQLKNRQTMDMAFAKFRKAITGAGGSDAEAQQLWNGFMGQARDAEGLRHGIEMAQQELTSRRKSILAGASPEVRAQYERNRASVGAVKPASEVGFKPATSGSK